MHYFCECNPDLDSGNRQRKGEAKVSSFFCATMVEKQNTICFRAKHIVFSSKTNYVMRQN